MKKKIVSICIALLILISVAISVAATEKIKDDTDEEQCDGADENVREEVVGMSPDGKDILIKRVTSHPVKVKEHKATSTNRCYKLMGIKWATQYVPYTINPAGSDAGMEAVAAAFTTSIGTWDAGTSRALFGAGTIDGLAGYGFDGRNAMFFGSSLGAGTIAQTTTWYYQISRQIVEFDIEFNNIFHWGDAAIDPAKMDLNGIATHELGHGIGLADLYTTTCRDVTMYGYSTEGEFKKRTLEQGDLNGLWKIYGR